MTNPPAVRLTQTVKKGGCAAKVAALELRKILSQVRLPIPQGELMIGADSFDDAAIYRIHEDLALVQTLDFFTPIVDTPRLFGRIAAANALSDVYAMGGKPVTAMAIFAFPIASLEGSVAVDVLQGASDVIAEAGASLVGGHTIDDETIKFGLSATGFVHPNRIWSNAGAKPGDALILTKALGTGTLTSALKSAEVVESQIQDGLDSMCQLNNIADFLSAEVISSIHAATDVTGFGLAGHALNVCRASDVSLHIEFDRLPRFKRAMELIAKGFLTKAHRTNEDYVSEQTQFDRDDIELKMLVFDPQTSGGLLLAVDSSAAERILEELSGRFGGARRIGHVDRRHGPLLRFS